MYTNKIQRTQDALTEEDIIQLETNLSLNIPNDLRLHYLSNNGGIPSKNVFIAEYGIEYELHKFLPMKYGNNITFEEVYNDLVIQDKIIPFFLIPFGYDPGNEYFCYSVEPAHYGEIAFFRTEIHQDSLRATKYIAQSLENFINSMVSD